MLGGQNSFNFLLLPRENQVLIMAELSLRDISAVTEVSHFLHSLVRNTPTLQYPIELIACGMHDNPHSTSTTAERLDRLRQHEQAWRTRSWSGEISFTVPPAGSVHSRQGLMVILKERLYPELGMDVHQLPAKTRNIVRQVWTIELGSDEGPQSRGRIYEVDASQDLLIVRYSTTVDTFFNAYTLSDGLPHPQAALPRFRISNTGVGGGHTGSTAGAFIRRDWVYLLDHNFEIYNWKTGERAMRIFSMLDECALVGDGHLATLWVSVNPSRTGLLIFPLPEPDSLAPPIYPAHVPVLAFLLPDLQANQETQWELVAGSAQSAADSNRASGGDFTTNRAETLLMILFRIEHQWYELIVPTQCLLEFLPDPASISMTANMLALREVFWPEWGPQNSRVRRIAARLHGQERGRLHASLFGMRRVFHHPIVTVTGELAARVEDYQRHRVRRAQACETSSHMVRHGDSAEGQWLGGNALQTELPFVEVDIILPEQWQGKSPDDVFVSINEDGIVIADGEHGEEYNEARTL